MHCNKIIFSGHAVQRMFERGIKEPEAAKVITDGEVIAEYPDDRPFPSVLILGFTDGRACHIVAGIDREKHFCYVITVYFPDSALWTSDYKKKRKPL